MLACKKRGSKPRRKAAQVVGKNHRHIRNQRKDFHHKEARKLVNRYGVIIFEKLQPANMSKRPKTKQDEATGAYLPNGASAKAGLNKSINDAGWSQFQQIVVNKAEWAGLRVLFVNSNIPARCVTDMVPSSRKGYRNAGIAVRLAVNWTASTTPRSTSNEQGSLCLKTSPRLGRSLQMTRI
jgi:transposase